MWRKKTSARNRRRAERKSVAWLAHCEIRGLPSACTVLDVSRTGVALILPEGAQVEKGETIVVHLERIGSTSVMCQFHATVRGVASETAENGGVRVGANFAFASAMEQRSARTLLPK